MNRRNSILLAVAVLLLAAAAVVVGVVVSRDDDEGTGAGTTTTETAPSTATPTFDAPGAAAPGEQDDVDEDVLGNWTVDDIQNAIQNPRTPPPDAVPTSEPPGASTDPSAPGGETAPSVEPTDPGPRARGVRKCAQPPRAPAVTGYAYTRDCYKRPFGVFPARAVGKLFFQMPGDRPSECTASSAVTQIGQNRGNESVLITAGHCLGLTPEESATGSWEPFTDFFWIPAPAFEELKRKKFPNQEALSRWLSANAWFPYTWANSRVPVGFVPQAWATGSGWRYDFGSLVIQPKNGKSLLKRVGGLGVNMNGVGANKQIGAYGYPADPPFKGATLFVCVGKAKLGDNYTTAKVRTALGIGCDMTGGSSGGPWLRVRDPGMFVVSVNSYGPRAPLMFGPNLNGDHWPAFLAARDYRGT